MLIRPRSANILLCQLLRHVYASSISAYSLSKFQASFATFLLSACLHELVMAVVSKKFRVSPRSLSPPLQITI